MNSRMWQTLSVALVLTGVACTDTTVEPKSTITTANVFTDPSSYQKFLAKIYAGLAVGGQSGGDGNTDISGIDGGFSQYLRLYWEHEELPTDEAVLAWGDVGIPDMNLGTWNSFNVFPQSMYYRIMFQVSLANEFLRQTTDAALASRGVTGSLKATILTYRAEARFLRALSYTHGMDLFGDIPLVTEADAIGTAPNQAHRVDIYNFVVSELNAIIPDLPASVAANYGRATTQAGNMLLAEVYLNAGVYSGSTAYAQALTAAQTVITSGSYSLDPQWRRIFQADNNNSPEMIFAITQDGQHTQTYGGVNFIIHAECGNSYNPSTVGIDGCWYGNRIKPEAYLRYDTVNDIRAGYIFKTGQTEDVSSISNFGAGYMAPKFQNITSAGAQGSNPGFVDTDFPMFRLSEAYLIYAEAAVRTTSNLPQALAYVNAIRERAYGCAGACAAADITAPQLTLQFILDERGRELFWEAHRRTDLVRFGLFTGGTYLWSWKGGVQAGTATDVHLNLYPIPATELVANPNLKQNPGYSP
ncbi:MAG TPA: RagB/SusD family nutrient uptake outer membrane protein [Gemmatimonadales bacterium]